MNKLRTVTLAAVLLAASVPSLTTTAQARGLVFTEVGSMEAGGGMAAGVMEVGAIVVWVGAALD